VRLSVHNFRRRWKGSRVRDKESGGLICSSSGGRDQGCQASLEHYNEVSGRMFCGVSYQSQFVLCVGFRLSRDRLASPLRLETPGNKSFDFGEIWFRHGLI